MNVWGLFAGPLGAAYATSLRCIGRRRWSSGRGAGSSRYSAVRIARRHPFESPTDAAARGVEVAVELTLVVVTAPGPRGASRWFVRRVARGVDSPVLDLFRAPFAVRRRWSAARHESRPPGDPDERGSTHLSPVLGGPPSWCPVVSSLRSRTSSQKEPAPIRAAAAPFTARLSGCGSLLPAKSSSNPRVGADPGWPLIRGFPWRTSRAGVAASARCRRRRRRGGCR